MVVKRLLQTGLFIFILTSQSNLASLLADQDCRYKNGIVILTHGMGAEPAKFDWYKNDPYVKTIANRAHQAGLNYLFVPWFGTNAPGGMFAGLLPEERIEGGRILAHAILDAVHEYKLNNPTRTPVIILIGYSFGGQVLRCACNMIDSANGSLGSRRTIGQELGFILSDILDFSSALGVELLQFDRIGNLLVKGWRLSKDVVNLFGANLSRQGQLEHLMTFVKEEATQSYLANIEKAWYQAFDEVQKHKAVLSQSTQISYEKLITRLITVATPNDGIGVFSYNNASIINDYINYYSAGDYIAPLIGKPWHKAQASIADLSVNFEVNGKLVAAEPKLSLQQQYKPGHVDLIGNIQMAPWLLALPEELRINPNSFFGREMTISFFKDLTKAPLLTYNKNEQHDDNNCCCCIQ